MNYLLSKKYDGTFTMNFIGIETLTQTDNVMRLKPIEPIVGIKKITGYSNIIAGVIDESQYIDVKFKYQNKFDDVNEICQDCWSDLLPISALTGITTIPSRPFDIEFYYFRVDDRVDTLAPTDITIGNNTSSMAVVISGEYEFNYTDGPFTLTSDIDTVVLKAKDVYKIFHVEDILIISDDNSSLETKWRVTQDNGRTFTPWEPLTKTNISSYRFNPLRFAKMEYMIKSIYPLSSPLNVYDVILIGDFQNITVNSTKTNKYGIREDCANLLTLTGNTTGSTAGSCGLNIDTGLKSYSPGNGSYTPAMSEYDLNMNFYTQGLSCYSAGSVAKELSIQNAANSATLWNPYDVNKITEFANMMANQLNDIFAWDVDYHLTDPDSNGIDFVLHEYQLFNIVDVKKLKVLVPDNKFPDNTVKMNAFSLDLFDTFEVHILKDEFKRVFGVDRRPNEKDVLFFCVINRLFYVKHAQVFRDIMNAGFYYKVILEKYEQKANIRNVSEESKALLDSLTKNTTMEELMGVEVTKEEEKIANLDQQKPFTFDATRYTIDNDVIRVKDTIWNGNIDFAKNYYDFKNVIGKTAITYSKTDNIMDFSSNRTFIAWIKFNNGWNEEKPNRKAWEKYDIDPVPNFWILNNLDVDKGYRIWYHKKNINLQINEKFYNIQNVNLLTNIWYGVVIIVDQRQNTVDMKVYQRDNDYDIVMMNTTTQHIARVNWLDTSTYTNLISSGYKPVDNQEKNSLITDFKIIKENYYDNIENQEFNHNIDITIVGSNMRLTNLRILNDYISVDEINNILNEFIIKRADKLLLADNADKGMYATNYVNKNWV